MPPYEVVCKTIGDPYIQGRGLEIGAGLRPIYHDNATATFFLDKRNDAEFEQNFGVPPPYRLSDWTDILGANPDGLDFVNCHHVIEHLDNPIDVLIEWTRHLKAGGTFYLSVPSCDNTTEHYRIVTPIGHILEDYFLSRAINSFESKQHIYSFVAAMAASGGEMMPWYAHDGAQNFSEVLLRDTYSRDDHDLHWHTYDLDVIRRLVGVVFHILGHNAVELYGQQTDDTVFLIVRKDPGRKANADVAAFRSQIDGVASTLSELS